MRSVTRYTAFPDLPEWLTPLEVQTYLGLSRNAVYQLLKSGDLASQRFGKKLIRVPREALRPRT